jgi:type IV secretion system protein VirD4
MSVERDGLGGFEVLVLAVGVVAAGVVGIVWAGAVLASVVGGEPTSPQLSATVEALGQLPSSLGAPASAWPEPYSSMLPGPAFYWSATALPIVVAVVAGSLALRWWGRRSRVGTTARRPLGVDARPRFARKRDLVPLLVKAPEVGRFVVARFGRWLVATEAASEVTTAKRRTARRGDRGAVALIGPSRSGKTTAAVGGILEWEGPAVLSSVKADLLASTRGWRSGLGAVRVYDPTSSTVDAGESARWSPLEQASTVIGAQRAARALCDAAPRGGVEGGMDFWLAQAEILLSGLLYVAHHVKRDMGAVCEWVLLQDHPGELGPGEVRSALDHLLTSGNPPVVAGVLEASKGLVSVWEMEERTRSSIYATAQTVVWPWSDPGVAESARHDDNQARRERSIDLRWLLSGPNTVYLCAPIEDQKRLAPAFGGLLNDLIAQAYRHVARTGRPLDPPLLVVIDEAGNTPLRALPEYASTLAGIGVLLVTIWQSLAQIQSGYGPQSDTILTNHLTKVFYAGLSDPASLRYVEQVLGDAEVDTRSRSAGDGPGRRSEQYSTTRVALAPAHALRQMQPGDALVVHGTLPPAHVQTRPFYGTPHLAERAAHPVRPTPSGAA